MFRDKDKKLEKAKNEGLIDEKAFYFENNCFKQLESTYEVVKNIINIKEENLEDELLEEEEIEKALQSTKGQTYSHLDEDLQNLLLNKTIALSKKLKKLSKKARKTQLKVTSVMQKTSKNYLKIMRDWYNKLKRRESIMKLREC